MFALRGIAVSLTFFVLLYSILSLLVGGAWRGVRFLRGLSPGSLANVLFSLRILPLVSSAAVTVALVVPAYVRLEPRSIDEDIALPLVLALGCLLVFAVGIFRVIAAQTRTARVVAEWLRGANAIDAGVTAPTFRTGRQTPPLTLVGVCSPRVVVSETTVALLNHDELRVAVQHEVAHIRSHDNLKKLVMYCAPFPGMAGLETAWHEAAELAADDGAVASVPEALDLAAALIKLSRLLPVAGTLNFTMALVGERGSVSSRVARLLAWSDAEAHHTPTRWTYAVPSILALILCAAALYEPVLTQTHKISEWLVR
ncbi:MAG TPA: M48 family metalloprotease [Terriglobales bacterium]|jgi:Zn-dependent protease with chaperone function|nr:M48 family metalloprotease [Terriglobales bacterium]